MRQRSSFSPPATRGGSVFRTNKRYGGGGGRSKQQGQYIDPTRFVNAATPALEQEVFVPEHRFSDFGLLPALERAVTGRGYDTPTPIQDGAIGPALEGRDVIGLANTGTGKTAAFVLPIIHRLVGDPQLGTALIMAPTRELAVQIDEEFKAFAQFAPIQSVICVGGVNLQRQVERLKRRPRVVIGTPGRLKDLFSIGALRLDATGILVLDEADRMLDMGFIRDIRFLLDKLPARRQSLCFSATLTSEIRELLHGIMRDPVTISVRTRETSDHVEQNVIKASSKEEKIKILEDLLQQPGFERVLIFGQTKWGVQRLAETLNKGSVTAEAIHGNKSQPQRQRALQAFKDGRARVLVATDVAARGLDIPLVSHVINFDQPPTYEDYVHRIGRTGRAGNGGTALTFVTH